MMASLMRPRCALLAGTKAPHARGLIRIPRLYSLLGNSSIPTQPQRTLLLRSQSWDALSRQIQPPASSPAGIRLAKIAGGGSVNFLGVRHVSSFPPLLVRNKASDDSSSGGQPSRGKRFLTVAFMILTGLLVVVIVTHIDTVKVSGRHRLILVSPETEKQMGDLVFRETLAQYKGHVLPALHPETQLVKNIAIRILRANLEQFPEVKETEWAFVVIDSPETNAFALPGGKVCVFRGIYKVVEDEAGLATVLSHEMAHVIARHGSEKMTLGSLVMGALILLSAAGLGVPGLNSTVATLLLQLPHSRAVEDEADHIGLIMMANACYDYRQAVRVWKKFAEIQKIGVPRYLSTHPSHAHRIGELERYMPEASRAYEDRCEFRASRKLPS